MRRPEARVGESSRAAPGSGCTASNEERASSASIATRTRSSVAARVRGHRDREHRGAVSPATSTKAPSASPATSASRRPRRTSSRSASRTRATTSSSRPYATSSGAPRRSSTSSAVSSPRAAACRDPTRPHHAGEERHDDPGEGKSHRERDPGPRQHERARHHAASPTSSATTAGESARSVRFCRASTSATSRVRRSPRRKRRARRSERLDALVDTRACAAEPTQGDVVRGEPLQVARERTRRARRTSPRR